MFLTSYEKMKLVEFIYDFCSVFIIRYFMFLYKKLLCKCK